MNKQSIKKIVLAYSGGLDTSVIIPWLKENYNDPEIIAVAADVGQGDELDGLEEKALKTGASKLIVADLTDEMCDEIIVPSLMMDAKYEKYLLGTAFARPVIGKKLAEIAKAEGADAIAHGCTGKGNDQVRFELAIKRFAPDMPIIAPWREWELKSRDEEIDYAEAHHVPLKISRETNYSKDKNLWHLSHEGLDLEDPSGEPDLDKPLFLEMSVSPYTHLQRAQPVTFGHHLMAYAMMLQRDIGRLDDAAKRMNVSPIGCCALAGTSFPTDREWEAAQLGFSAVTQNSIDGIGDRDFCVEFLSACAMLMMHLSRLCEELVLWSSWEFHFIELDDAYTTGSSIMPQKKNPDMAELCRGKTGRVYGDLIALLTTLKGLPLAYNKDMQEDKEAVFDCADTVKMCLKVCTPMIATMKACTFEMYRAVQKGFLNATDLAGYLTKKGVPFRSAYKTVGQLVAHCIEHCTVLEDLPLELLRQYDAHFDEDVYPAIALEYCVANRVSVGGTGPKSVEAQIAAVKAFLSAQQAG